MGLNHLPLNGTNIYIRVWSQKVNGDWVYDDYELETEAKTPATKQVTRSYLVTDHLDTPRFIYDDEKALSWRWASDGFGRQAANDDPDGDGYQVNVNLGFPGQYKDLESGLVYNWNRYYDSDLGRYVTSDPIGLDGGLNTYGYVGGNPLVRSDPDGLRYTRPRPRSGLTLSQIFPPVQSPYIPSESVPVDPLDGAAVPIPGSDPNRNLPDFGQCTDRDRCTDLRNEARKLAGEILARLEDMRIDKCKQYIHARYTPNPSRNCGGKTTWAGHGVQISDKKNALIKVITRLLKRKCTVPPSAWRAYNSITPLKPRGYK